MNYPTKETFYQKISYIIEDHILTLSRDFSEFQTFSPKNNIISALQEETLITETLRPETLIRETLD